MSLTKLLAGVLSAFALIAFVYSSNTNAQSVCDVDCEGSTLCTLDINGTTTVVAGVNFMDGDDPVSTSTTEKEVKIVCKDLSWGRDQDKGNARNDESKESKITLTSQQDTGTPFYPADARVEVYCIVDINGREFQSDQPLVLKSLEAVQEWPSAEEVKYELVEDVTFEGHQGYVTFKAGGTATMKGR